MKIYLEPTFGAKDKGDGGIRRVWEGQVKHLPNLGIEFVSSPELADIVHCHAVIDKATKRFIVENPQIPFICQSHGLYWEEYEWEDWALKTNRHCIEAIRLADVVVAPSEWVAQAIRRNSLRPTVPIAHGIDLEDWDATLRKDGYVLWNKTRLDAVCDLDPVMKIADMMPNVQFISTFGRGNRPNVRETGRLPYDEAKRLVERAGLYLCTARETFGIGTIEAMACSVPVVGWAWGGQREIIQHKETGWLATPNNFDELAEGIEYCLKHRDEMGAAARAVVEKRYQWKDVMPEYLAIYERLMLNANQRQPRVSIIVPAYNLEAHLPEALDSVLAQTSSDWECIVVDDASPDRCGEIAEGYAGRDRRFTVVHNTENRYLSGALNTGIASAKGHYILPLDADNILPPQAVELLDDALDKDRQLDIAYGNVEFLEPDGRKWHSGWPPRFRADWQVLSVEGRRPSNLIPSGSMYRRRVHELTGGYRRRWRTAEDADFWTRATSYGFRAQMVTQADVLVYRNRDESMSRNAPFIDWTNWYPWSRKLGTPPAAIDFDPPAPIVSYEPVLVSVVIPVGPGHEELVIDAIDSVDAQTFRLWECIVVNDTGKPLPMLPNWVRIINTPTKKPKGVAAARNAGIRVATAKLFVPLDADDTLESTALAAFYKVQQEFRGYVYSDWYQRWDDGEASLWELVYHRCLSCEWIGFKGQMINGMCPKCGGNQTQMHEEGYRAQLLKNGCIHAVTGLYPVDAWKRIGGFDEKLPNWEDWDFQISLANLGICGTRIPDPLFTYRKDTGKRREENAENFDRGKEAILAKWGDYFTGGKELMACRSCGGGKKVASQAPAYSPASLPPPEELEGYTLIEYVGLREGIQNYVGPSGQNYRFAALETERLKLVVNADAQHFIDMRDFRAVQRSAPVGV